MQGVIYVEPQPSGAVLTGSAELDLYGPVECGRWDAAGLHGDGVFGQALDRSAIVADEMRVCFGVCVFGELEPPDVIPDIRAAKQLRVGQHLRIDEREEL